jgi:two-component system nitrogen regulation response regulator NtrX
VIVQDRLPFLCLGCLPAERKTVNSVLEALGFTAVWATSQRQAQSVLSRGASTILLDLTRPDSVAAARALRSANPDIVTIGVAKNARRDRIADAVREGAVDVVSKPIAASELARAITLARRLRNPAPSSLLSNADAVFVRSASMRSALDGAWRAALDHSPTLIIGEPQTGREFLARTIHRLGGEHGSFIHVDCAQLRPGEIEGQLHGIRTGGHARTGARSGALWSGFHAASVDTLFLKDFAAMPPAGRAIVARAVHLREASEGSGAPALKVRLIVGAGPSAGDERACGELCADAPFIRLHVPPLRHRREDIPLLASHFVECISSAHALSPKVLTDTALALLAMLPWRGNAGELRSLLEKVVVHAPSRVIRLEDILPYLRPGFGSSVEQETLRQARSSFEREYITGVLERHGGRIAETAKALGMLRPNLHRKMKSLRIVRASTPALISHAAVTSRRGALRTPVPSTTQVAE